MNKNTKPSKALVKTTVSGSTTQVKLGEIFECEGILYSITINDTITGDSNLEDGRSIFKFIKEYCH